MTHVKFIPETHKYFDKTGHDHPHGDKCVSDRQTQKGTHPLGRERYMQTLVHT